jgi:hypothetical protein
MTGRSLADERIVEELERARKQLLSDEPPSALLTVLRRRLNTTTENLYILTWIPEQREDLYDVLVDGVNVVHLGIPRGSPVSESLFDIWSLRDYRMARKHATKPERRKLEVAIRLATSRAESA